MKYSAEIQMVQEDDLPAITYQIRDRNRAAIGFDLDPRDPETWRPLDITGAVVSVDIRDKGGVEVLETVNLTILDAATGAVMLNVTDALFVNNEGKYELETRVVDTGLQQTVYDFFLIDVRSRIKTLL